MSKTESGLSTSRFAPYHKRGIAPQAGHAMLAKSFTFERRAPVSSFDFWEGNQFFVVPGAKDPTNDC